jgi:hypothetical protein
MNDLELQKLVVDLLRVLSILLFCWALSSLETDEQP